NPTRDQTDEETIDALESSLTSRFQSAWALVRSSPKVTKFIYPNAYHIKVAVRDSETFWLSSGNWNNSNQPDMDPINNPNPTNDQKLAKKSDRDWHVIVENTDLAEQFEAFLKNDFTVAGPGQGGVRAGALEEIPEELRRAAPTSFQFHAPLRIE